MYGIAFRTLIRGTHLLDCLPLNGNACANSCLSPVNGMPENRQPQGPGASPRSNTGGFLLKDKK